MSPAEAVPFISLAAALGSMAYTWRRNSSSDRDAMWDAIKATDTEVALLKKQGDLFWGLIEQQMAKALIRPTHIELDSLLEKVVRNESLSKEQDSQLDTMLRHTIDDKGEPEGVRAMAATILAIRLARRRSRYLTAQT